MNADFANEVAELIDLEEKCPNCFMGDCYDGKLVFKCHKCDGSGKQPTLIGKKLLAFMITYANRINPN